MLEALAFAQEAIKSQCEAQIEFSKAVRGDAPKESIAMKELMKI